MKNITVPEAALDGTYSTPLTPAVGPAAGDQSHPLSIPLSGEPFSSIAPTEQGPSTQASQYKYAFVTNKG